MIEGLLNLIRRECERIMGRTAQPRSGIIDGYDPTKHAVRVRFDEEQDADGKPKITGWLPIKCAWAGNNWGLYLGPQPGTQAVVDFHDGDPDAGFVAGLLPNLQDLPLPVPAGEAWLVHASGQFIKLLTDGTIASNGTWNHTGSFHATGDVSDGHGSLDRLRQAYDAHRHPGVQSGGGVTGLTDHNDPE